MGEGICAIDARRDPSYNERNEEEEGNASVKEGLDVILAQRDGSSDRGDAEDCWSRWSPWLFGWLWLADFDVD